MMVVVVIIMIIIIIIMFLSCSCPVLVLLLSCSCPALVLFLSFVFDPVLILSCVVFALADMSFKMSRMSRMSTYAMVLIVRGCGRQWHPFVAELLIPLYHGMTSGDWCRVVSLP